MTNPKCPECSKVGVEMIETPTKFICPRCNLKVEKLHQSNDGDKPTKYTILPMFKNS